MNVAMLPTVLGLRNIDTFVRCRDPLKILCEEIHVLAPKDILELPRKEFCVLYVRTVRVEDALVVIKPEIVTEVSSFITSVYILNEDISNVHIAWAVIYRSDLCLIVLTRTTLYGKEKL